MLAYACEQMIPSVKEADQDGIVKGLRSGLYGVWKQHVEPFYEPQEKAVALQMIAGIVVPNHRSIYVSNRSIWRRDSNYVFVGCGSELGYYLAKQRWSYETTIKECVEIAKWIIAESGDNVPNVGRIANITFVDLDGNVNFVFVPPSYPS